MEVINKESFIQDMEEIKSIYKENERIINGMITIGFDIEALIFERLSDTFIKLVDVIADKYDINRDAMSWFIWENSFGENKRECSYPEDDKNYVIDGFSSFWNFEKRQ
jgi:hypothetical protein